MPQRRRGSARGSSLIIEVQGIARSQQAARAETRENAGSGKTNETRLSRALFNNKSGRLRGATNTARNRIRMASEQDEEEEHV
jgi:hypothetical protein